MYTAVHGLIEAQTGEPVRITFNITDNSGAPVTVAGASATYKIARKRGDAALLTKTETAGIVLSGATAVVDFNTAELVQDGAALLGDFYAQLKITKNGDGLVVAEGAMTINGVIF